MPAEYIIQDREPIELFRFFEDISAIPRGSGNESGVADYLCAFAEKRGLWYRRDSLHNVLIKKSATKGYEGKGAVMLQGHTDMVCEKNSDTDHDFEKEGLKLAIDGDLLYAKGTTLGGDDGIAVAMMLAILDSDSVSHPDIECLFTVQEETGLGGAEGFDYSDIKARVVINLDSENEYEATAGCAGGERVELTHRYDALPFANKAIKISISGLAGGHSGVDINKCRSNSNKLMGRILSALYAEEPFNLISINGGNKDNAIPRECEAVISVFDRDQATDFIKCIADQIKKEQSKDDKGLRIRVSKASGFDKMMTFRSTQRVISVISLCPSGVLSLCPDDMSLVESSSNLGVITTTEDAVRFDFSNRSSVESVMSDIALRFDMLAKALDCDISHSGRYPGWRYTKGTEIQRIYAKSAKEVLGDGFEPRIIAIHAGLECGIILSKLGEDAQAISIGPTMYDIHTPKERLSLSSCERTYRLVCRMLEG